MSVSCLRIEGDEASEGTGRLSAYVSFGGLLMRLQVKLHFQNLFMHIGLKFTD